MEVVTKGRNTCRHLFACMHTCTSVEAMQGQTKQSKNDAQQRETGKMNHIVPLSYIIGKSLPGNIKHLSTSETERLVSHFHMLILSGWKPPTHPLHMCSQSMWHVSIRGRFIALFMVDTCCASSHMELTYRLWGGDKYWCFVMLNVNVKCPERDSWRARVHFCHWLIAAWLHRFLMK